MADAIMEIHVDKKECCRIVGGREIEEAAALLDQGGNVQIRDGAIEALYRADGAPCPDGDGALRLLLTWEVSGSDPSLVESTLTVFTEKDGKEIYSLETARYRKEAAA